MLLSAQFSAPPEPQKAEPNNPNSNAGHSWHPVYPSDDEIWTFPAMSSELVSLIRPDTTIKVSSTLDKSVGRKYLVDDNPETCWTSQQGLPQSIQLTFSERVIPRRVSITFQGGFVGIHCAVYGLDATGKKEWRLLKYIYPEDVNRRQSFDLYPVESGNLDDGVVSVRLVFEKSSDFFGRITVYDLRLEGWMAAA